MRLDNSQIGQELKSLEGWSAEKGRLHKEFKFETFEDAIRFIDKVAIVASSINHHPEINNVYNKVTLNLDTHDEGGITELDFTLARLIDQIGTSPGN
ncbi:MAG: 4a-hydroxytetrahydrobiopterin dehydratase [Candidatus Micrarchaeota archaeon]|nr:4a-hydroxytetrahydrobiopterin dehydratase [Candidatus Micrarchaeota archaeon]